MSLEYNESYHVGVLLNKIKLKKIMSKKVVSVEVDDPFNLVEEKMRVNHIRHLPVVDVANKAVGIITQRDLYRIRSPRTSTDGVKFYIKETLDEYILAHTMTKNPFTLKAEDSLAEAIIKMAETKFGCVPIVDKRGVLCGIVTQTDIMKRTAKILKEFKPGK